VQARALARGAPQTAVDTYAKKADAYFQEMVMLVHKVDRHEKWFSKSLIN